MILRLSTCSVHTSDKIDCTVDFVDWRQNLPCRVDFVVSVYEALVTLVHTLTLTLTL